MLRRIIRVRAHRSPGCFLYIKSGAKPRFECDLEEKQGTRTFRNYCRQDKISLFATLCFGL